MCIRDRPTARYGYVKSNPAASATESRPVSDGEPQGGRPTTGNLSADQRPGAALLIVLGTLLGASLIFLAVYHFRTYRTGFHSDGAYRNILAAEMLRTGQVFPAHFVFVNDIPIFFGHIFIVLLGLLGANPVSYTHLNRGRWQSRLLWRLDRGAYPKTPEQLLAFLSEQFSIVHSERFSIYHEYLLAVATNRPAAPR